MAQTVYTVTCKSDGSLIAVYATEALADERVARAAYPGTLQVQPMNVLERDVVAETRARAEMATEVAFHMAVAKAVRVLVQNGFPEREAWTLVLAQRKERG